MDNQTNTEPQDNKHFSLYVLELEHGKYYVGITTKTPEFRMRQHINGFAGARWTSKHKPITMQTKEDLGFITIIEAQTRENLLTRELMKEYGYNNVRGGDLSYSEVFIKRFGWLFTGKDWEIMSLVVLLILIILILSSLVYIKR